MTITFQFCETIWPCIGACLDYLQKQRNENITQDVRSGINFSIILGAACYLEGSLESILKALLLHQREIYNKIDIPEFITRRSMNVFYNRIEEDLEDRVATTLGAAGYDQIFELVLGQRLSTLPQVSPLWEGLTVLFKFRNVIGHRRQVNARKISTPNLGWQEEFSGGYRATEDYLNKKSLLQSKFIERHSEYLYLSDPVADHFWELAQKAPKAIVESMSDQERMAVAKALDL